MKNEYKLVNYICFTDLYSFFILHYPSLDNDVSNIETSDSIHFCIFRTKVGNFYSKLVRILAPKIDRFSQDKSVYFNPYIFDCY